MSKPKLSIKDKALALVPTVHNLGDGSYTVAGEDLPHLVLPASNHAGPTCTCLDFRYRGEGKEHYRCKHILAVRLFLEQQRTPRPPSIRGSMNRLEHHLRQQETYVPKGVTLQ